MDIRTITTQILPTFDSHKNEEDIEIEFRLGKYNGKFFDTNVGKETFERVLYGLKQYNAWEKIQESASDVFYNDKNGIRITCNQATGERTMIQKINVSKEDFISQPLDVRFSISREIPASGEYEMDRKRTKTRYSFLRKNLSIDMTISSGDNVDMDSEEPATYQIEFEIIKADMVDNIDALFKIIHKIKDLSKLISR
jgi:hypothetical protein|tara:strand:- start:414 stop:1004 length:591 start_codon:yes stop_codon:yes gene_type:complete